MRIRPNIYLICLHNDGVRDAASLFKQTTYVIDVRRVAVMIREFLATRILANINNESGCNAFR